MLNIKEQKDTVHQRYAIMMKSQETVVVGDID